MTRVKIGEAVEKTKSDVGMIRAIFTTIDGEQCYAVENEGHAGFRRRSETGGAISGRSCSGGIDRHSSFRAAEAEKKVSRVATIVPGRECRIIAVHKNGGTGRDMAWGVVAGARR